MNPETDEIRCAWCLKVMEENQQWIQIRGEVVHGGECEQMYRKEYCDDIQ